MKLRSRGLGRKELVMDFREYEVSRDGDDVVVTGTIREPVNWDFTIRITGDDIPGMLRLGLHRHTLAMATRWALRRRSKVPPAPEAAPVAPRPPTPAVSPRAVLPDPGAEPSPVAPRPTQATARRPPVSNPISDTEAPDFGVPRRRGWANGEQASATDAVTEGERR